MSTTKSKKTNLINGIDITRDKEGRDMDWMNTSIYQLVYDLMNLPA